MLYEFFLVKLIKVTLTSWAAKWEKTLPVNAPKKVLGDRSILTISSFSACSTAARTQPYPRTHVLPMDVSKALDMPSVVGTYTTAGKSASRRSDISKRVAIG